MFQTGNNGFTLLELMIVIAIIAIIAAIAIPNLKDARMAANEAHAITALRAIHSAQNIYREQDVDGNGTLDYADIPATLADHGLLEPNPGTDWWENWTQSGYKIGQSSGLLNGQTLFIWSMVALPERPGDSGKRYFFIDQTGVIRYCLLAQDTIATLWPAIGK